MGGCCQICNYNRCIGALEFHHIDPKTKEFGIYLHTRNPLGWDKIKSELAKCILLCSNCHREVHYGSLSLPQYFQRFDESLIEEKYLKLTPTRECSICADILEPRVYICPKAACREKRRQRVDWSNHDVIDLIENQKLPKTTIATMVGCSDNAVKKRYLKLVTMRELNI